MVCKDVVGVAWKMARSGTACIIDCMEGLLELVRILSRSQEVIVVNRTSKYISLLGLIHLSQCSFTVVRT